MYLGIDIGGTKTLVATLDSEGVIQQQIKFPTPREYPDFIRDLAKTVAKLSTNKFVGAGVAFPGRIDRQHGIGLALGNLPWRNVPIQKDVERMTKCPVVVENDAKLAGLSEAMLLRKQYKRVLYITVSTGIGTGVIIDQKIDPAFQNMEGGEIFLEHHGKMQMWEHFASGSAIAKRFGKQASEINDVATWNIIAHDLALGIIDLIPVVQPEVIVFGGGVGAYFNRFGERLQKEVSKYATPLSPMPALQVAARPNEAVIYGCYDLVKSTHGKLRRKIAVS